MILLSSKKFFEAGWYSSELRATLDHDNRKNEVQGYLMHWEDIFEALIEE